MSPDDQHPEPGDAAEPAEAREPTGPDGRTGPDGPAEPAEPADPAEPRRPRPTRGRAALVVIPIIVLVIGNYAGGALFPTLVTDHPLLLVLLSPSNRNFVFVADRIDPTAYYVFGTLRLLAPDPLFFLLGRWYGDAAITWMERRTPTYGQMMRTLERWFSKASWPIVTVIPNNPVCLLAGAAGMSVGLFAALNVIGTIGRLVLLKLTGRLLANPIGWLLDLIARYRLPLLAVSISLVGFTVFREWRAGTNQIEQLLELEEELEEIDEQAADD
ncbi:MAG: DedA family protein [Acidimicrobiales bacterium]